jgi:hypothetical protein
MPLSRINTNSIANNSINASDLLDASVTAAKIISVANTQITGNIVSSQITSIGGSQITANTIANSAIQTGAVENYMNAAGLGFGMRNRIINGAMIIDQRNAGAATTAASGYGVDRFYFSRFGTDELAWSIQQDTVAPAGFVNSQKVTITTAETTFTTNENATFGQVIEGLNIADLGWGTANAKTVTLSFWVRSSLTGTFGGALFNSAADRFYPFSYTILAANTWEYETITIAGDTSGTWLTTNGAGIYVQWGLGQGPDRLGTAGAWTASNNQGVTGQVQLASNLNATWQITGVQLEKGSTATSFDYRSIGTETDLCRRYYLKVQGGLAAGCAPSNQVVASTVFPVAMRATPTADLTAAARIDAVGIGSVTQSPKTISSFSGTLSATGAGLFLGNFAGVTAGASAVFYDSTNGGGDFTFSAEL